MQLTAGSLVVTVDESKAWHLLRKVPGTVVSPSVQESGVALLSCAPEDGQPTSSFVQVLGCLCCDRFMGAARLKRWWMGPFWGSTARFIPLETQFLLVRMEATGPYAFLMPLVEGPDGSGFRAAFAGNVASNALTLRVYTGDADVLGERMHTAVIAVADRSPYEAVRRGVEAAARVLGTFQPRRTKAAPTSMDYFGWCTWNAFYSGVTPAAILEGVATLRSSAGVQPRTVIIDDGWQSVCVPSLRAACADEEEKAEEPASGVASAHGGDENSLQQLAADVVAFLYRRLVEPAAIDSPAARAWRLLTSGPLRGPLLRFFDSSTDFSKALVSFKANRKFEHDGESLATVVRALRAAGVDKVYAWHALAGYWSGVSPNSAAMGPLGPRWKTPAPTMDMLMVEPAMM